MSYRDYPNDSVSSFHLPVWQHSMITRSLQVISPDLIQLTIDDYRENPLAPSPMHRPQTSDVIVIITAASHLYGA